MAARTTIRTPMPIKMRAKQFMMFDAMKGLTEAIAEKEQQSYPKKELTEERKAEINTAIAELQPEIGVEVIYYCQYSQRYRQVRGIVRKIDPYWKQIQIDKILINFDEIAEITESL